jgi:hypothetical protein
VNIALANPLITLRAGDFYVRWHATLDASIPAGDVTDGSGAEYKPDLRGLRNLTSFSIIAPATNVVSLSFFAKPA